MKKRVSYENCQSKGVAYIRHHICDRLVSNRVVADRVSFNINFWTPFRNSSYSNFFEFLKVSLTTKQLLDLVSNDKRQIIWTCGITPQVKTSCLVVMKVSDYKRLDSLTTNETYYACYSVKRTITSANDVYLTLQLPKI